MSRRLKGSLFAIAALCAVVALALAVGPAHAGSSLAQLHSHLRPEHLVGLGPLAGLGLAGMLAPLEPALDYQSLVARRTAGVKGYRVFPDFLVDTVNYPAAGPAAGSFLQFFSNVNAVTNDNTLSNLPAGQLPAPQMFWIQRATIAIVAETTPVDDTASAAVNITRDFDRVVTTSRSFFQWNTSASTTQQGSVPLRALGQMGGVVATFGGNNVPAAAHGWIYHAPRLTTHGGFPMDVILFPQEKLNVSILFGVQVAISAQTPIRVELYGWRYVPVGQG